MSNRPAAQQPAPSTDRPTSTYPTGYPTGYPTRRPTYPAGWQAAPAGYVREDDPRLAQADATPTAAFPTRRSIRPALPQHGGAGRADAASLSHGGARPRAVYHTAPSGPSSEQPRRQPRQPRQPRRHLLAALTGIALAALILTGLQLYALDGINDAREAARAARAARPVATSQPAPSTGSMSGQTPMPERAPENARTGIQPEWVTQDTGAPYDRTDASASPLSLPRCTTSPTTPMPCLAYVSADSNHAVVLEEDASLTGLVRQ